MVLLAVNVGTQKVVKSKFIINIATYEEGKQGRSYDLKKEKAVIAVEFTHNNKVKSVYIKSIDDYSAKSLTQYLKNT